MRPTEKLAALTAMEKALKDAIKAARAEANDFLMDSYEDIGVERMALKLDGEKVGEFVVTFNKEGFQVTDREAFEDFALDYGLATVKREIRPEMMESAIKALEDTFEPEILSQVVRETVVLHPDWEKAMENVGGVVQYMDSGMNVPGVAAVPKTVKGTMVRGCEPAKVFPIIAGLPEGFNGLLLGEGAA